MYVSRGGGPYNTKNEGFMRASFVQGYSLKKRWWQLRGLTLAKMERMEAREYALGNGYEKSRK